MGNTSLREWTSNLDTSSKKMDNFAPPYMTALANVTNKRLTLQK
jgi:hypothetical protein